MPIKVLDAGAIERTITQIKVMDAGNVERTIAFVRVMDAGGVVREVYTAGGGGGGGGGSAVSITPAYYEDSGGKPVSRSYNFSVNLPAGATATSYQWSVLSGPGTVSAGGTSQSATLTCRDGTAIFNCDVVIDGATYSAQCTMTFNLEL